MRIPVDEHRKLKLTIAELQADRRAFWDLWREVARYFLPKRYVWLATEKETRIRQSKNPFILDSTGTSAARVLASGMMNGITSPSRPWFKLRIDGFDNETGEAAEWCEEVARRMLFILSESNFYNAMAVMYLDLAVFGSAAMLIYEDEDTLIRCYNPALGEFYFSQNDRLAVDTFAREYVQTVKQLAARFGEENLCTTTLGKYKKGGASSLESIKVTHLIRPNVKPYLVSEKFKYVEVYWETSAQQSEVLSVRGFNELPGVFPRWEVTANDNYGTSPAMDALPDVIQLQHETKRKAQSLDKMLDPPIVADIQLQHRPTAMLPGGITYVAGSNNVGAKPLYQITAPLQELTTDIRDIQGRIRETLFNSLFNMISSLETVRSATEIDARREEKLVLLGSVLERFENEALDPAINRVFSIMSRAGLLPEPPEAIDEAQIQIQYVSILSQAQRAVGAAPTERWLGLIGNIAGADPSVLKVPNMEALIRNYGVAIGVEARNMRTPEEVDALSEQEAAQAQAQQAAVEGRALVGGAKTLSETDVGGGSNALQTLLAAS